VTALFDGRCGGSFLGPILRCDSDLALVGEQMGGGWEFVIALYESAFQQGFDRRAFNGHGRATEGM
jgi:hypothetical protein